MKKMIIMMIALSISACFSSAKPAPRLPGTPPVADDPRCTGCSMNGTQLTGLVQGDQAGAVRAIALPSGEVVTPR